MAEDCLFCRIVAGDVPASRVAETARTLAFRDVNPQAPTHVLVIPKEHHRDVAALVAADPVLLSELVRAATGVAEQEGVHESGWRLVFNTGLEGGQTVSHVHGHVLGGRRLGWPPG